MPGEATAEVTTFPGLLRHNGVNHTAKTALITEDRAITHGELDAASRALAARFVAAGVGKGARVGLLAPNGIEWAVTAAAVMRIGGVLVPLSTLLRPPELEAQLRVASVTHLVLVPSFRGRAYLEDLEGVVPKVPSLRRVWTLDDPPSDAVDDQLVTALEDVVRPADDLVVLFTSGSRGAPKGVVHTHGGALRAVASGLDARCIGPGDRLYIPMPFFWTGGFSSGLLSVLLAGATLITEAIPDPVRTLELLERERVTLFRGWPDQAAALAAHPRFASTDLSSLGQGSLPAVLSADRRSAPGARANVFGMTETCGPYAGARLDRDLPAGARGSCGRPFDGFEVRIVAPEDGVGEICVRGPNVMRGICGRTRAETFDADGWYPTGDLGSVDAAGYLRYRGRMDDMFKVGGATVFPSEVESALRAVPGVQQAHVTAVGGEVGALVVSTVALDELVRGARERLSAFKLPTRWVVAGSADTVPMTATSKIDTAALQALLQREGSRG